MFAQKKDIKKTVIYSHIVAAAQNHVIGRQGQLPWHIPEDLKFFHKKTKGKILIMGRKTFQSLGKPLPSRLNIVLSRKKTFKFSGGGGQVVLCSALREAYAFCEKPENHKPYGSEVFIIGGGEIYRQSLSQVKFIYLTRIHQKYTGDAFYPQVPLDRFQEVQRRDFKGPPSYSFITYGKKTNQA